MSANLDYEYTGPSASDAQAISASANSRYPTHKLSSAATSAVGSYGHGHGSHGHGGGYALVSDDDSCCAPVTDPLTLVTVLGAIGAITIGLRQEVIRLVMAGGRRRRRSETGGSYDAFLQGKHLVLLDGSPL